MSQENVKVVMAGYDAAERQDGRAALELLDEDSVWDIEVLGMPDLARVSAGRDDVRGSRALLAAWDRYEMEVERVSRTIMGIASVSLFRVRAVEGSVVADAVAPERTAPARLMPLPWTARVARLGLAVGPMEATALEASDWWSLPECRAAGYWAGDVAGERGARATRV